MRNWSLVHLASSVGCLTVMLLVAASATTTTTATSADFSDLPILGPTDYCEFDTFKPQCGQGEVIVIRSARYGRMKIGRCVSADLGYVGCSADVLDLVDALCSGRRSCAVPVPHQALAARSACMHELKLYLEVSYSCLKVATVSSVGCHQTCDHVRLTSPSGYLATDITRESGCGGVNCPWHIRVPPSQAVELTLFNFARMSTTVNSPSSQPALDAIAAGGLRHHHFAGVSEACRVMATVRDVSTIGTQLSLSERKQTITRDICASAEKRASVVFRSDSSIVELRLVSRPNEYYVIHYRPVGCDHQLLPPGVSVVRPSGGAGSEVTMVTCNYTGATWRVDCFNGHWLHPITDIHCEPISSSGEQHRALSSLEPNQLSVVSYGLLVASVMSVAIVVSTLIIVTGLIIYRRKYAKPSSGSSRGGLRNCKKPAGGSFYFPPSSKSTSHTDSSSAVAANDAAMIDATRDYTLPADSILPPPPPADYFADQQQNVVPAPVPCPPPTVNQQRGMVHTESAYAHIWQHATMMARRPPPPFSPNTTRARAYPGFTQRNDVIEHSAAYDGLTFNHNSDASDSSQRYFYLEPDSRPLPRV